MVVIETKSQIMEMDGHETAIIHPHSSEHLPVFFHLRQSFSIEKDDGNTTNLFHRLLIFPSQCSDLVANGLPSTGFIHEGYMKLTPLLYSCTVEFSLMCLTVSYPYFSVLCVHYNHLCIAVLCHLGKYWKNI